MKRLFSFLPFILISVSAMAQDSDVQPITDSITAEGKAMYRSEMASWYGTDIFLEAYKNKENIGGYLSYVAGDTARCIFFSHDDTPVVIGTIPLMRPTT